MPAVRQRVRRSARLQANARTRPKAMELPPNPSASRGRGKSRGRGSNSARNQPPKAAGPKIIVHWTRAQDLHRTDTLVTHLTNNPSDARTLFYEGKKTAGSSTEERPSGRDKGDIHRILSQLIFEKDSEYSALYAEDPKKFDVSVGNRCTALRKLFRDQHDKFNKTGAGVTPLDEHAAANLHKQVLLEFPWYDQLHPFLFSNPTIGAKVFTSQPGVDHAADYYSLIPPSSKPSAPHPHPPDPQLFPPDPQLPLQNHQSLPSDPQLPLWSPPDTSAQCAPPSIRPGPTGAQHAPPNTLHPPPFTAPPHHFSGTGGSPIDDPDGDLDDDLHADENDLFSAPLGNALGMLGGGDADMDDDEGMELDPSCRRVISLDSPPRLVGQKRQYAASPSPPPVDKPMFLLPWKLQTPTYHSREAFGSASPGGQVPRRPSSFASSSGISRSRSTPSSTASSSFASTDYCASPTASQTSLSAKPRSSASSKKKRSSVVDMADDLNIINEDIRSMKTDISERRESRNERYAIKMNYQAQKKDLQWRRESLSHEVLISATTHQREQEAKDKEIQRLQAAAALQEKEAETWRLRIQYEMMIRTAGAGPSSSSPSA
ncbi:hypothetical protein DFJ58DRAFT_745321 [Suillus subalutaceus]|uniref:uncharacterized protein n=1 Tax=Suillus subalutaceus TaxID=48586 RepID=UPI001B85CEA0|nr:uncharacterized protein DFJ58DRAFT_745321 [Suillus subalutaceus]KAG1856402.1 hypothetical protein DFJ58DRAFT_745321 [Suillus subalutaceus]